MPRLGENKNLNEFFKEAAKFVFNSPRGMEIKRSDLRHLNNEFGMKDKDKPQKKFKTFDEARQAYKEERNELVVIQSVPQSHGTTYPRPAARA